MAGRLRPIRQDRFLRTTASIILVLTALFLLKQLDFLLGPLLTAFSYLLTPVLLSLFLYYILRPLVRFLTAKIRLRGLAILLSFLLLFLLIFLVGVFGGGIIQEQIKDLTHRFANYYDSVRHSIYSAGKNQYLANLVTRLRLEEKLGSLAESIFPTVQRNLFGLFSAVTNIGAILVLIPFILFYFLKDDRWIFASLVALSPVRYRTRAAGILRKADTTLARYMQGQSIIAAILGCLTFLGYLLIGLPNAFILAVITMITSFIPIFGALIGALPAALVGLAISPLLLCKVFLVLVVVQQLEGNLISPRLQGARMNIHPLMVLFVVIVSYALFGVLGSLFAVPTYAVLRVMAKMFWAEKWLGCGEGGE